MSGDSPRPGWWEKRQRRPNGTRWTASDIFNRSIPEPNFGCWLWTGAVNSFGYGNIGDRMKNVPAHRMSYAVHFGDIPPGQMVLHKCDVRSCVNPTHLFLGDHASNMTDMLSKGRSARGTRNARAKLTPDAVREIRASSESQDVLAEKFGVSQSLVSLVRLGAIWRSA